MAENHNAPPLGAHPGSLDFWQISRPHDYFEACVEAAAVVDSLNATWEPLDAPKPS